MADRKTHKFVGIGTGALTAAIRSKEQTERNRRIETLGGAVGGYVGGMLPDWLEPAVSPRHRGPAHSCAAAELIIHLKNQFAAWETMCRTKAEQCAAIQGAPNSDGVLVPVDPFKQLFWSAADLFWRFLAGLLSGLAAGYVSHLALDAMTPLSLPAFVRGC